ncbi:MAG: IS1380 family transposase, partial [Burkholderiales bacterium]|nr:IS1380 family transposase [Burkholderiales bacterium]
QLDQKIGWTESFSNLISDPRTDPKHTALSIIRQRVFGIIAGYEDQNDHDSLRSDPIFKMIAEQSPDGEDLASQPTIS